MIRRIFLTLDSPTLENLFDFVYFPIFSVFCPVRVGVQSPGATVIIKLSEIVTCFLCLQGEQGLNVVRMLMYLIKDNRKLLDSLTQKDMDVFISLLKAHKVSFILPIQLNEQYSKLRHKKQRRFKT